MKLRAREKNRRVIISPLSYFRFSFFLGRARGRLWREGAPKLKLKTSINLFWDIESEYANGFF